MHITIIQIDRSPQIPSNQWINGGFSVIILRLKIKKNQAITPKPWRG
jgi:hypothetical protein